MKKLLTLLPCITLFSSAFAQDPDPGFTLWNGRFEKTDFQIEFGYVNKSWISTYPWGTDREDFFGDPGKFLHGMQIGALYTPSFDWGLGLRTGIMFEFYFSRSELIKYLGYNGFNEVDLYIPLQASFRIPFNDRNSVSLFCGPAFQLAMDGRYTKSTGYVYRGWYRRPIVIGESKKMEYGYGWPERVNWQVDCGLSFRFGVFGIDLSYSFGIRDHGLETYDDNLNVVPSSKSRQDKINASLFFAF